MSLNIFAALLVTLVLLVAATSADANEPVRPAKTRRNVESVRPLKGRRPAKVPGKIGCGQPEFSSEELETQVRKTLRQRDHRTRDLDLPSEEDVRQRPLDEARRAYATADRHGQYSGGVWTFQVYFIEYKQSAASTGVTSTEINQQLDALNDAFAPQDISFELYKHEQIVNSNYFSNLCQVEHDDLPIESFPDYDPREVVAVFLVDCITDGLYGFSTFPFMYAESSKRHVSIIDYRSLPGGNVCNQGCDGDTLIHELGHYFYVFHTFQGGCAELGGDLLPDTPPEAEPTYGCAYGTDTCTNDNYEDGIHNFMAYSDDYCLDHFTDDQLFNVRALIASARPNLVRNSLSVTCAEPARYADGHCDSANNVRECDYDGGDCCFTTCHGTNRGQNNPEGDNSPYSDEYFLCNPNNFDCVDPWASENRCGSPFLVNNGVCNRENYLFPCWEDDCDGTCVTSYIEDGWCDPENNKYECFWDGGDCCASTCNSGLGNTCGSNGFLCKDPQAGGTGTSTSLSGSSPAYTARTASVDNEFPASYYGPVPPTPPPTPKPTAPPTPRQPTPQPDLLPPGAPPTTSTDSMFMLIQIGEVYASTLDASHFEGELKSVFGHSTDSVDVHIHGRKRDTIVVAELKGDDAMTPLQMSSALQEHLQNTGQIGVYTIEYWKVVPPGYFSSPASPLLRLSPALLALALVAVLLM